MVQQGHCRNCKTVLDGKELGQSRPVQRVVCMRVSMDSLVELEHGMRDSGPSSCLKVVSSLERGSWERSSLVEQLANSCLVLQLRRPLEKKK